VTTTLLHGDCRDVLPTLEAQSVQVCVTSPPYWGLRDYGVEGQIGQEQTLSEYVQTMVAVFREVQRVLKNDGTLWLNLGDSYTRNPSRGIKFQPGKSTYMTNQQAVEGNRGMAIPPGLEEKNLLGIPWRVAFALQDDGWILRSDIIWSKPNPMPESITDRPTKAHEYLFLFAKQPKYYYDADAIAEPAQEWSGQAGTFKRENSKRGVSIVPGQAHGTHRPNRKDSEPRETRNKRSVWSVNTRPYADAHFAVFPEALVEPCILAGSRSGDTALDPFMGSGTVARVATRLQRHSIGIELNPDYIALQEKRTDGVQVAMIEVL
jgi:DNA modification methylase